MQGWRTKYFAIQEIGFRRDINNEEYLSQEYNWSCEPGEQTQTSG